MYQNFTNELAISVEVGGAGTKSPITTATLGSVTGQLLFPTLKADWSLSNNTSNILFVVSTSTTVLNRSNFPAATGSISNSLTIFAYNPATSQTNYPSLFWHQTANSINISITDPTVGTQIDGSIFFNTSYTTSTISLVQPQTWLQTSPGAQTGQISAALIVNVNPSIAYANPAVNNVFLTTSAPIYDIGASSLIYSTTVTNVTSVQRQIWLS